MAVEKEEAWKAWRAAKWAEKQKAVEEAVEEEVVVVDGPGEEARPKKWARTAKSNTGPDGELEMKAAEAACKRSVTFS